MNTSSPGSTNAGSSVVKISAVRGWSVLSGVGLVVIAAGLGSPCGGQVNFDLKRPSMLVPRL